MGRAWASGVRLLPVLVVLGASSRAHAVDYTFSGSGALDYRGFVGGATDRVDPNVIGINSLALELSHKIVVDVTERIGVTLKICFGCHGIEVDQGYAELHGSDFWNLRIGRFNVPIGEFNVRHDPANYTTPSKPLPYAMGDMLYYTRDDFNLGVVPTPYSDDGLEVFGSAWIAERLQLDYTVFAVRGFAGQNDLDFAASRRFTDNNQLPSVGARMVATLGPVSLGGSVAGGTYDNQDNLAYYIFGGELYARVRPFVLRGEYIVRRTDIDRNAPGYQFVIKEPYFLKIGYYAQIDWEINEWLSLIYRFDGLRREGIPLPGSRIDQEVAQILRSTAAVALRPWGGVLLKADLEWWAFSGVPFPDQPVVRVAVIYSY